MEEPALKKMKPMQTIDNLIECIKTSDKNLYAVLSDEYYQPPSLIQVYVGKVKEMKELSRIILYLNTHAPLKDLNHLKRARKNEVILCPTSYLNTLTVSIQQFIEENLSELKNSFDYFKVIDVPALPAKLKSQHLQFYRTWSSNFHPDKYLEKLFNGDVFDIDEIKIHRLHMAMTLEIAKYYLKHNKISDIEISDLNNINASIVYDPKNKSIVAASFDNRENHPVQHSAMLAIDNVAKTQDGGAWNVSVPRHINLRGFDEDLLLYLKSKYKFLQFGAKSYISKKDLEEQSLKASDCPYLCTGYYIYLLREPCVMCSMGLVHARANRVFYCFKNNLNGALGSRTKLQCVPALNHHFEVFTNFLDDI